jgi:DNA-binding NarL/FixJ family response regulator
MQLLFFTSDLMFVSQVAALAQKHGRRAKTAASAAALLALAAEEQADLVIIDLNTPGADPPVLLPQLRALAAPPRAIIAYGPHVHEARLAAAAEASCDEVLSRGAFNARLPELLAKYLD